jgi:hypothetical protein
VIGHEKPLRLCQTDAGALKHPAENIELRRYWQLLLGLTFDESLNGSQCVSWVGRRVIEIIVIVNRYDDIGNNYGCTL